MSEHPATREPVPGRIAGRLIRRAERSGFARSITMPIARRIRIEETAGWPIIGAAIVALLWANSGFRESYHALWETSLAFGVGPFGLTTTLRDAIETTLLPLFFLVLGLEIRREVTEGFLDTASRAALPLAAAVGGMVAPIAIYLLIAGHAAPSGFGVPVATDVPFGLAMLMLLGKRIPTALKVFLLAFSAIDDVGGVMIIAIFYGHGISLPWLGCVLGLVALLIGLGRARPRLASVYLAIAVLLWVAVLQAGFHGTVAGVLVGLLVPTHALFEPDEVAPAVRQVLADVEEVDSEVRDAKIGEVEELAVASEPISIRLDRILRPWVSYLVLPLFALAMAGTSLNPDAVRDALGSPAARGVALGLVVGKPLGILLACWLAMAAGITRLPEDVGWPQLTGVAILAGIGFTVSLFIAKLAFRGPDLEGVKLAILGASGLATLAGVVTLLAATRSRTLPSEQPDPGGSHSDA